MDQIVGRSSIIDPEILSINREGAFNRNSVGCDIYSRRECDGLGDSVQSQVAGHSVTRALLTTALDLCRNKRGRRELRDIKEIRCLEMLGQVRRISSDGVHFNCDTHATLLWQAGIADLARELLK